MGTFEVDLVLLLILLLGSVFFSGSETALYSLSKIQQKRLERQGDRGSRAALEMLARPKRLLASLLLGNTFVNILATALATDLALATLGPTLGIGTTIFLMTILLLVFCEVTPKVLAAAMPMSFARTVGVPLEACTKVLGAPAGLLVRLADRILEGAAGTAQTKEETMTAEDISAVISAGARDGVLATREKELIEDILELSETDARDVMVPRVQLQAISEDWPLPRILKFVKKARFARIPVYRKGSDDVIGVLATKEFLLAGGESLEGHIKTPLFIPEGKPLNELLQEMLQTGTEIAIVLDEHGQTAGLVTLEDVIEEIFGEVYDEDDAREPGIVRLEEGTIHVPGRMPLEKVIEETGLDLATEEGIETMGGLTMHLLGRIPRRGDTVYCGPHLLTVTRVIRRSVREVIIRTAKVPPPEAEGLDDLESQEAGLDESCDGDELSRKDGRL